MKNLPLAERTGKLKNHTTLNLFGRPLSLDNVGCHISTNMQQNAAFSNQLEERSPTWPSARHSVMESRKRNRNGWQWWFHGCQMSLSLSGRVFAFKSTGSFIEQSWIYKKKSYLLWLEDSNTDWKLNWKWRTSHLLKGLGSWKTTQH